jgi:hypothetical protein
MDLSKYQTRFITAAGQDTSPFRERKRDELRREGSYKIQPFYKQKRRDFNQIRLLGPKACFTTKSNSPA